MRRKEDHQEDAMRSEREPCKRDYTLRKEILLEKTRRILKYLKQYIGLQLFFSSHGKTKISMSNC